MEIRHPRCCGLDVHKKTVEACVVVQEDGTKVETSATEAPGICGI